MSSTTPEQGSRDRSVSEERPAAREEPQQDGGTPPAAPRSADSPASAGTATSAERAALRTSLAERFAAAKGDRTPREPGGAAGAGASTSTQRLDGRDEGQRDGGGREPDRAPARDEEDPRDSTRVDRAVPPAPERGAARPAAGPARPAGESTGPAAESARPAAGSDASSRPLGPRQVRLSLARVDPWSVMKLAFLLSIAVGIGIVVATAAMWYVLDSMHVFADVQALLDSLGSESFINLLEYAQFDRVISMAAIIAVVDIVLLTALATLGAFLYNIVAALVGGLHLTLTDD